MIAHDQTPPSPSAMQAEIERLRDALLHAANVCDGWAEQSRHGGWSTHQVSANLELANDLRRIAVGRKP